MTKAMVIHRPFWKAERDGREPPCLGRGAPAGNRPLREGFLLECFPLKVREDAI